MFQNRLAFIVLTTIATLAHAQGITDPPPPDGTEAAIRQIAGFRLPEKMKIALFAAEPKLASPVAFCLDEKGRVFVAEEFRFNRGTEENRTRPFMLDDDLQIRTLDDRLAMFKKHADKFAGGLDWFTKYTDQIRLLEDADGDGRADRSTVFADGFNGVLDGMASGVIARDGDVYVTSIPHLWRLRDLDGDGKAEVKEKLLTGFGVNASFLGHDLHGLVWGPDGKLYFSIGDRGCHVTAGGKTHALPRRGAVFRCMPDGSQFEVVHVGLRNPQELAFDDFGNLFADDNNSDKGDDGRLVYIVEGGDSGWCMPYQTLVEPYLTGPWHAEKMWHAATEDQPQWLLPRVGKIGNGPSGFTHYPGIGLDERYRDHFFMANYTGGGGIESFAVQPAGASFEIVDYHDFWKPMQATDVDFGYDGKMYVSDFVGLDWGGASKGGRIYMAWHEEHIKSPEIIETTKLFREGFDQQMPAELARLLGHADQRVRLRAQYALASLGDKSSDLFIAATNLSENRFARLHALWGLGQIASGTPAAKQQIAALLSDDDLEIRAHAARLVGDVGDRESLSQLVKSLDDKNARVQFFAAQSLGKLGDPAAIEPLWKLAGSPAVQDRYVRHAIVFALHRLNATDFAASKIDNESSAVRMTAVLVLRRSSDLRIGKFLNDKDPLIVLEAARAINDLAIDDLTPDLAALSPSLHKNGRLATDPLVRRVINANFRLGAIENVGAVAQIAADPLFSVAARREAIQSLGDWLTPSPRDRVNGDWRPLATRDPKSIETGLPPTMLVAILAASTGDLQKTAIEMAIKLKLAGGDDMLLEWFKDPQRTAAARAAALRLLAHREHPDVAELFKSGLADASVSMRSAVFDVLAETDREQAQGIAIGWLKEDREVLERQAALAFVAKHKSPATDAVLKNWVNRLTSGEVSAELLLDVIEAARSRQNAEFNAALANYEKSLPPAGAGLKTSPLLQGGNAERGRSLFVNHAQAQCIRCHKVEGIGGGNAGPDLSHVSAKNTRAHLLESILVPNAKIAEGFGSVTLELDDGRVVTGLIKSEEGGVIDLQTPTGTLVKIANESVETRSTGTSPMPAMDKVLSPQELRDVVEFLSGLK